MPKSSENFRKKYKIASAAMITSLAISAPIAINANEVETEVNEGVVVEEPKKEEVKEEVKEEPKKEEVKEEVTEEPKKEEVKEEVKEEPKKEEVKEEVKEEPKKEEVKEEVKEEPKKEEAKEEVKEEPKKEEKQDGLNQSDKEQLAIAIEEMRIAIDLIDNADLTNKSNFERLERFSAAAKQRINSIDKSNANSNEKAHIEWILDALEEVRVKKSSASRLIHAMDNVKIVFESSRKDILKNKQIVLDILGDIANQERFNVNTYTSGSAYKMYHDFYAIWNTELDEAVAQLGYAIEEVREAVNCMNNKDLTVAENLDRMKAFAQAAIDRLEGLYVLEGLENYSQHIENLKANLKSVEKTIDIATQIRNAMDKVIDAFEKGLSRDEKIQALDTLGSLVDENRFNINTWTSYTAMELYHKYYEILDKVGDGSGDDNMEVEPPVGDGSGDDNMEVEPPVGDGSGDDNMEVEPPVGDGSGDDNMEVEPPVGDGSGDDNMEVEPPVGDGSGDDNMEVEPPVGDGSGDDNMEVEPPVGDGSGDDNMEVEPPVGDGSGDDNMMVKPSEDKKPEGNNNNNNSNNNNNNKNPQTGDVSMLSYIGLGLSSVAGLMINRKRK